MDNLRLKIWVAVMAVMAFSGAFYGQTIAQNRDSMDTYYKNQEDQLRLSAEEKIQQVEKAEKAKLAKEDLIRKNLFFEDNKFMPNKTLLTKEDIAHAQQQVDEAKQRILKDLNEEIAKLERQKEYFLKAAEPAFQHEVKPPPYTVNSIVYSSDKASAVLGDIIFAAGDTVKGAHVVRIYKDRVEFEKNGHRWSQKVGEPPKDFWK